MKKLYYSSELELDWTDWVLFVHLSQPHRLGAAPPPLSTNSSLQKPLVQFHHETAPKMSRGTERLLKSIQRFADLQYKIFSRRYGHLVMDILDFPVKVVLSPFTLAFDIAGSAPRGFGVPEFISKLSYSAIFVSTLTLIYIHSLDNVYE